MQVLTPHVGRDLITDITKRSDLFRKAESAARVVRLAEVANNRLRKKGCSVVGRR